MFDFDGETVSLKNPKLCDVEEKYETIEKAVHAVSWYGKQSVYTTSAIEKIFILTFCVEAVAVFFDEIFELVTHKVANFLQNSPASLDEYSTVKDKKDDNIPIENIYGSLQEGPFEIQNDKFFYESLVSNFIESFDSIDIIIFY